MAITNGYATLAEFKQFCVTRGQSVVTDALDDTVIEDCIETASRYIDRQTCRTFYARTETRLFDVPAGRELKLDDDLISVTTLTNGDTTVLTTADYQLLPYNASPKYAIRLKQSSAYAWTMDADGNTEGVISVAGSWGWGAAAPDDIKLLTEALALNLYKRRTGENVETKSTVTAAGVVITPGDVPSWGKPIIEYFRRLV